MTNDFVAYKDFTDLAVSRVVLGVVSSLLLASAR
jgi:hypothetical protein